jgi:hypothetical protein
MMQKAGGNMDKVFAVDWGELLIPTHSVMEMIVRGTLAYLACS